MAFTRRKKAPPPRKVKSHLLKSIILGSCTALVIGIVSSTWRVTENADFLIARHDHAGYVSTTVRSSGPLEPRSQRNMALPAQSGSATGGLSYFDECLRTVLNGNNLPIGQGFKRRDQRHFQRKAQVWAHHGEANTGKWNDEIRFEPLLLEKGCRVWEVGANTEARDSQTFMERYTDCEYHAYEPIPSFFTKLEAYWSGRRAGGGPKMHVHNYGLADKSATYFVEEDVMNGHSTFIGDATRETTSNLATANSQQQTNNSTETRIPIEIKSFHDAIQDAGGKKPTLLHMNCEGCEWDFLPQAIETGFVQGIDVIQVGTHNYGDAVGLGGRIWQLCEIRTMLSQTHDMVKGLPFGWERWVLKK